MRHEEAQLLLSDLVLGELEADAAAKLRDHLAECAACRRERDFIEVLVEELREGGEEILAGHPDVEDLAAFGLGDTPMESERRAGIECHLRICRHCREELDLVRRAARAAYPTAAKRPGSWRNWLVAALLLVIVALAWPAYRGIFNQERPQLVVHSGQLLNLPEPGLAQQGEVPVLALADDLSHLPVAVAWDLEIRGDQDLLFSLAELPSGSEIWSERGRASRFFDAGLKALSLMVPAGGLGAGTYQLVVKNPRDGSVLGSYRFRLGLGGRSREGGGASVPTPDGGFLIAGETYSFGLGQSDGWVIKTDEMGLVEWSRSYGGLGWDGFADVIRVEDGYVLCGWAGNAYAHLWLLKISEQGDIVWDRRFGTERAWDNGREVVQLSDGGFAAVGYTNSYGPGAFAVYLVRTDAQGRRLWQKTYGGENNDVGYGLVEAPDGGLTLVARTGSFGAGGMDAWVVHTDAEGEILWDRTFGSEVQDHGTDLVLLPEGGYLLVGSSELAGIGSKTSWLRHLDEKGDEIWYRGYPEGDYGYFHSAMIASTGDLVIAGSRADQRSGETNYWVAAFDLLGEVLWSHQYGGVGEDMAQGLCEGRAGGYLLSGTTSSWGAGDKDFWIIKTDAEGHWEPGNPSREIWDRVLARMRAEDGGKPQL